ncbi:MAG: hypothetical protein LBE35_10065 [Clostridiales bacterium]|jgi:NADH:ubiquinone oxidoreductase subunit 3 (subunit A)|nr:hypothetical protein [Clostridiales bacterium]
MSSMFVSLTPVFIIGAVVLVVLFFGVGILKLIVTKREKKEKENARENAKIASLASGVINGNKER